MTPVPLPRDARRALFLYNLLFPFVFLALLPGFLARMLRRGGFQARFGQRLGHYSRADRERWATADRVWIHSISVGETLIALKLARELHDREPTAQIVLSTTTTTGFALARDGATEWLDVTYNPIDFLPIVRRAFSVLSPCQLILIEGEAWPNLLAECRRRGVPVSLVNARLSPRSEARFRRFRVWTGPIFRLLDLVCVPDEGDVVRWQSLGVNPARIRCTGSIKFDAAVATADSRAEEFRALIAPLGFEADTPILFGGSTWAPEEGVLTRLFIELRVEFPTLHLILAPRHVERTAEILRELAPLGLRILRRSALPLAEPPPCEVLLIDTTGELCDWYEFATIVFVGKSLPGVREIGGQNPAEPALLGKPVIFGPHMENFTALAALLIAREAALQITDPTTLGRECQKLLASRAQRRTLGENARHALASHSGATSRVATLLFSATCDPIGNK